MAVESTDAQTQCMCRYKATERDGELQADLQKRLNRAIGQLNGVKKMIDDNRYCDDILIQLAAAEKAIRRVAGMVLQEHVKTCLVNELKSGNDDAIDEVIDLMQRFA